MWRRIKNLWAWSNTSPYPMMQAKSARLYPEDLSKMSGEPIIIDTRNPVETLDIS